MHLRNGIKLYSDLAGIEGQLTINEGTMLPDPDAGLYYHPGSFVPKPIWRHPEPAEIKILLTKDPKTDFRKSIYVGDIPAALKQAFALLELDNCASVEEVLPQFRKKEGEVKDLNEQLHAFLQPFSSSGNYKFHRITRAMPNRETITCLYSREKFIYIGLHIDESRTYTPYTAYKSGNRISINLSKETRYLAFINLSLIQVMNMIKEQPGVSETKIDAHNIAYLFFKHYSDYPVVKIGVKPYQYYIAPTDNFFHDGSTAGNKEIDVTIVYTGVFDMPN